MALRVGTRLGHYDVTALIGEGGMGQVWQATDTQLNRQVALKILPDAFAANPDRLARFKREAQILASLNHPNIAAIYGIEESEGTRALVLELVEGPTLADRISKGPIPLDEALPIAKQIAEALEAAHEAGVIHRDLKPANIKVREDGTVKVLDFGLAKALDPAPDADSSQSPTLTAAATQMGVIMGTAAYMSPEQASGSFVDKRADIWSFGVVLFEMLTGQRLFTGESVSHVLGAVLRLDPQWDTLPDNTPASLRRLLDRCLIKDRKQRLPDIGVARFDIDDAAVPAVKTGETDQALRLRVWQRPAPAFSAVLLVAVIAGLSVWTLRPIEPRAVTRFSYDLPPSQRIVGNTRQVLAVSPDGQRFVYNTTDGLYLRSMDQPNARLLSGTGEGRRRAPVFSWDGQSVAFESENQLMRLALSGGAPVNVGPVQAPLGASWASDNTIFFSDVDGIMRVTANGGTPEVVVPAEDGKLFDTPQLLPDGDSLLFSVMTGGTGARGWDSAEIVVQSLTSADRTVLLQGGSDARYVPTGHLVYALGDGLLAVAFDVDRLTVESGPVSMVEGIIRAGVSASANYAVSDNGSLFYLTGGVGTARPLVWVDRVGNVETIDTIPRNAYGSPRLSPDGARTLVVADGDLWIYDIPSGRENRLTTDGETPPYADWTPSGVEVTYTSFRGGSRGNVWIQAADGSGAARQLTSLEGRVDFEAWAPDGRTFAAHHHGTGPANQLMVSVDGTDAETEVWLEREFTDSNAVFSPDGRYIAHVSDQSGQFEIYIRPFPGPGAPTPVSVGGGTEPMWAATGELFYRRLSDYSMMVVAVSTDPVLAVGPPTELFAGGSPSAGGGARARYAVTADAQRFLMSAAVLSSTDVGVGSAARSRVNVVLNWVEELKRLVPIN